MQKKNLLTKEAKTPKVRVKKEKVYRGYKHLVSPLAQQVRLEKAKAAAEFMDTEHSIKQSYKEQDLVILLDVLTGSECVVKIQKITNQEEVYVKHHKGKHSSRRDQWLVGIDSIVRLATPKEIRAAELRG